MKSAILALVFGALCFIAGMYTTVRYISNALVGALEA